MLISPTPKIWQSRVSASKAARRTIHAKASAPTRTLVLLVSTWTAMTSTKSMLKRRYSSSNVVVTATPKTRPRSSTTSRTSQTSSRTCQSSACSWLSHWLRALKSALFATIPFTSAALFGTASSAASPSIWAASSDGSRNLTSHWSRTSETTRMRSRSAAWLSTRATTSRKRRS